MKKIIAFFIVVIIISGCGMQLKDLGIRVTPKMEAVGATLLAYNIALEVGYQHPDFINRGIAHCDAILASKGNFQYLYDQGIAELEKIAKGDPVQQGNLAIILSAVEVDGKVSPKNAKIMIEWFRRGLVARKK